MTSGVQWTGLEELKAAMRALPRELADRAGGTVRQRAYAASARMQAAYPVSGRRKKTGGLRLRAGVDTTEELSTFGIVATVRSRAKHSHLWEFGTGLRVTNKGHRTGQMTPNRYGAPVAVPTMMQERARMHDEIVSIMRTAGVQLEVVETT
jgi:hypothetical protein